MLTSICAVASAVSTSSSADPFEKTTGAPPKTKRLARYAVAVAARLLVFGVLSPIGTAAHQQGVSVLTANHTATNDDGYAGAVTYDRDNGALEAHLPWPASAVYCECRDGRQRDRLCGLLIGPS